jgi:Lrp/AsnC family transcriptional regulator, regulator for asnA, asnC and gidA
MPRTLDSTVDDTDIAILEVLQRDGRAPFSVIARELGLPESTVRQRCRKIFDSGLVSIVATGDPLRWGIAVDAIHLVRVEPGRLDAVAEALKVMPEVRYVSITLGGALLIVESLHHSADDLHAFLVHRLPSLAGVKEVDSHQIVDIRSSVWDWRAWLGAGAAQTSRHTEAPVALTNPDGQQKEIP